MVKVQAVLEEACYTFGQLTIRDVLHREGCDCPESTELNLWARIFLSNQDKFATVKIDAHGKPFAELLESITALRHTAVEDMLKDDQEYQSVVSANLEQAIISPETITQSLVAGSEADLDAGSSDERGQEG